ncbi:MULTISPECIES: MBL fold metallo-hydrolase [Porphyromonas]|uniref:MBL fold metallo-hydrolase n=1 Tax=Porphyromonas TaxID=836 RepID=UPI000AAA7C19|nr:MULTISPECIES: MBL fold metallo-hydrolase [Porphyromonas]
MKQSADYITFFSIGSGSSGNCYFFSYFGTSLLIDAGLRGRTIADALKDKGIDPTSLSGILVTHDHADHVRGVGSIATRYHMPIYATRKVMHALITSRYIQEDITGYLKPIDLNKALEIGSIKVHAIPIPHDSTDNIGYMIETPVGVFTLMTDIGDVTPEVEGAIRQSNFLVFESNYDEEMLKGGKYPQFLKERITCGTGHLSNTKSAECLACNYHLDMTFIALCHLSKDNNHPDLAYKFVEHRLFREGIRVGKDLELMVLKRSIPSEKLFLRRGELPIRIL